MIGHYFIAPLPQLLILKCLRKGKGEHQGKHTRKEGKEEGKGRGKNPKKQAFPGKPGSSQGGTCNIQYVRLPHEHAGLQNIPPPPDVIYLQGSPSW